MTDLFTAANVKVVTTTAPETKVCRTWKTVKPLEQFPPTQGYPTKDGLRCDCKQCVRDGRQIATLLARRAHPPGMVPAAPATR